MTIGQATSMSVGMTQAAANAAVRNITNATSALSNATNSTLSNWAGKAASHIGNSNNWPSSSALVTVALAGLALAGAAACLSRATWHGQSSEKAQPRLADLNNTADEQAIPDVAVEIDQAPVAAPEVAQAQAAQPEAPQAAAENAAPAQTEAAKPQKEPVAEKPAAQPKVSMDLAARTATALKYTTAGQKPSTRDEINAPRAARDNVVRQKQAQGISGRQASLENRATITANKDQGLAERQQKVAEARARRDANRKPAVQVSVPSSVEKQRAAVAAQKFKVASPQLNPTELTARTNSAVALHNKGSASSQLDAVKKPRVAREALLQQKQQAGMQGRTEHQERQKQIAENKAAELALNKAKIAAVKAGRSVKDI